ncbi:MAG: ComF family protein [Chloroflexota bacterium]
MGDTCEHPKDPDQPLGEICVAAEFEGAAREAVHALKYEGRHAISGVLGSVMALAVHGASIDRVVAVPLHARRRRERGYDQAQMLAHHVARRLERPHDTHVLKRVRYTTQQATLGVDERHRNMAEAFDTRDNVAGETILLVDDVLTTGATLNAAAMALTRAGADRIVALVFARAPHGRDAEWSDQARAMPDFAM